MMIREAMSVFWQTLKDAWEELYSIAIVNLVWLFCSITVVLFPVTLAGMFYVTNRVAHGKTFHFSDFIDGMKKFWWRSLLWFLATIVMMVIVYADLAFYASRLGGLLGAVVGGFWIGVAIFWLAMQMYFWPVIIEMERPRMLLAWRNSAYLILANPFFAFFIGSFFLVLLGISAGLTLPLIFVGAGLIGLLCNNAVLTLYVKFGVIKEARPKPL
jgi:hypothetical protein